MTRFSIVSLLYNNTATPKSGRYTLGLETSEDAEADSKVIDLSLGIALCGKKSRAGKHEWDLYSAVHKGRPRFPSWLTDYQRG